MFVLIMLGMLPNVSLVHVLMKTEVNQDVCLVAQEVDGGCVCERVMESFMLITSEFSMLGLWGCDLLIHTEFLAKILIVIIVCWRS